MTTELMIDDDTIKVLEEMGWYGSEVRELAFAFFIQTSRIEYCLLKKGFRREGSKPWGCWKEFAKKVIKERPSEAKAVADAHSEFLIGPPGSLIEQEYVLKWQLDGKFTERLRRRIESGIAKEDFDDLCLLFYQVRNNLFHGNKGIDPADEVIPRLKQALEILKDLRRILNHYPDKSLTVPVAFAPSGEVE